jgi:hypothetical protein
VARLDSDQTRVAAEQVVPGEQGATAGDRGAPHGNEAPHERLPHRHPRELQDVAGGGVVARDIEAVGANEVGMRQAEPPCLRVHEPDEVRDIACRAGRQRKGGVVRALDQRRGEKVANPELLSDPKVDARLAHRRCGLSDGY